MGWMCIVNLLVGMMNLRADSRQQLATPSSHVSVRLVGGAIMQKANPAGTRRMSLLFSGRGTRKYLCTDEQVYKLHHFNARGYFDHTATRVSREGALVKRFIQGRCNLHENGIDKPGPRIASILHGCTCERASRGATNGTFW